MKHRDPLKNCYIANCLEAGCDEAGRGCLAGAVFAAAVVLPNNFVCAELNDSKQLSQKQRDKIRVEIENNAIDWAVAYVSPEEIDKINILKASILAMHRSLDKLKNIPENIIVDGNKFFAYQNIPHTTIVKGDSKFMSIAAASVLAKTHRDEYMAKIHDKFPQYDWATNKGYPTEFHRRAIAQHGISPFHRKSFKLNGLELKLF